MSVSQSTKSKRHSGRRKLRFRGGIATKVFCRLTMVSSADGTALGLAEKCVIKLITRRTVNGRGMGDMGVYTVCKESYGCRLTLPRDMRGSVGCERALVMSRKNNLGLAWRRSLNLLHKAASMSLLPFHARTCTSQTRNLGRAAKGNPSGSPETTARHPRARELPMTSHVRRA